MSDAEKNMDEPQTDHEAEGDTDTDSESHSVKQPQKLKPLLLMIGASLIFGAVGGYAGHRLFERPVEVPDIAPLEKDILALKATQKNMAVQIKTEMENTASNHVKQQNSLEAQLFKELADMKAELTALKTSAIDLVENEEATNNEQGASTENSPAKNNPPPTTRMDPAFALSTSFKARISELETRITALENMENAQATHINMPIEAIVPDFPIEAFLSALDAKPEEKSRGFLGRLFQKHISVTDQDRLSITPDLQDIHGAIKLGNWDQARDQADKLPDVIKPNVISWLDDNQP